MGCEVGGEGRRKGVGGLALHTPSPLILWLYLILFGIGKVWVAIPVLKESGGPQSFLEFAMSNPHLRLYSSIKPQ